MFILVPITGKDIYVDAGYGWDEAKLWNRPAWQAERRHFGKNARKNLFPSYFFQIRQMQSHGNDLTLKTYASEKGLTVGTAKRRLEEEKMSAQRTSAVQVWIDPAPVQPPPKQAAAMAILNRLKESKQNLDKENWNATIDIFWIPYTLEKFQNEIWSSLPSELQEEMLALIPVHHCHRLGIGEAKKEMIRRLVKTA